MRLISDLFMGLRSLFSAFKIILTHREDPETWVESAQATIKHHMKTWCLAPFNFLPYFKDVYHLIRESLSVHADELYRSDPHEEHELFGVHHDGKGVLDYTWNEETMRWGYLNFNRKVWDAVSSKFSRDEQERYEPHLNHILMFEPGHDSWKQVCSLTWALYFVSDE